MSMANMLATSTVRIGTQPTVREHKPNGEYRFETEGNIIRPSGEVACDLQLFEALHQAAYGLRVLQPMLAELPRSNGNLHWFGEARGWCEAAYIAINAAAMVSKILDGAEDNRGPREFRATRNAFYAERGRRLTAIFEGIDLSPILDRKVRDGIEHFDHWLDRELMSRADGPIRYAIAFNVYVSDPRTFEGPIRYVRSIVGPEPKFVVYDHEIRLDHLATCLAQICDRAAEHLGPVIQREALGAMLVF